MPQLNVRINEQLHRSLVMESQRRGRTLGAFVRDLLMDGLERGESDFEERLEDLDRRLARLESLAER